MPDVDKINETGFCDGLKSFSSWTRLRRVVALCLRFVRNVKQCLLERKSNSQHNSSIKKGSFSESYLVSGRSDRSRAKDY